MTIQIKETSRTNYELNGFTVQPGFILFKDGGISSGWQNGEYLYVYRLEGEQWNGEWVHRSEFSEKAIETMADLDAAIKHASGYFASFEDEDMYYSPEDVSAFYRMPFEEEILEVAEAVTGTKMYKLSRFLKEAETINGQEFYPLDVVFEDGSITDGWIYEGHEIGVEKPMPNGEWEKEIISIAMIDKSSYEVMLDIQSAIRHANGYYDNVDEERIRNWFTKYERGLYYHTPAKEIMEIAKTTC